MLVLNVIDRKGKQGKIYLLIRDIGVLEGDAVEIYARRLGVVLSDLLNSRTIDNKLFIWLSFLWSRHNRHSLRYFGQIQSWRPIIPQSHADPEPARKPETSCPPQ